MDEFKDFENFDLSSYIFSHQNAITRGLQKIYD